MTKEREGWQRIGLNLLLLGLGGVTIVLLYALIAQYLGPSNEPQVIGPSTSSASDIIQVEVRNGCGVSGLAAGMTEYLRQHGFDVVEVGDHSSFNEAKTLVVDRVGNLEAAKRVAEAIGIPEDRVKQEIRQDYFLDASIIIGQDYETLAPFEGE